MGPYDNDDNDDNEDGKEEEKEKDDNLLAECCLTTVDNSLKILLSLLLSLSSLLSSWLVLL